MKICSSDNHLTLMPLTTPEPPFIILKLFFFLRKVLKMFYLSHMFCILFYLTHPTFCDFMWQNHMVKHDFDDVRCFAYNKRQHTTIQLDRVGLHEGVLRGANS